MGSFATRPDGSTFLVVPSFGGQATSLAVTSMSWGRLVDVFGLDANGGELLMQEDFVVSGGLVNDPLRYELDVNPVTGAEVLTILRDVTNPGGLADFFNLLVQAEINRTPIFDNGAGGTGQFTMVPRNAAIVVEFNDLLDPALVSGETVRLLTGSPSLQPFEARIFADRNHGDFADLGGGATSDFYSTRLIIDAAVSEIDAFEVDPPIAVNGLGFPPSIRVDLSNIELRIPTQIDNAFGQEEILRNVSGHSLDIAQNGTADMASPTLDIVRGVRAGGSAGTTADPFNGFLRDQTPPKLIGSQATFIESAPLLEAGQSNIFTIPALRFNSTTCARTPQVGDVLVQPRIFAEVIEDAGSPIGGLVTDLRVRLLLYPPDFSGPEDWSTSAMGSASYLSVFDSVADAVLPECFVEFAPAGADPNQPTKDLGVGATVGLRFSEPMDPDSVTAFDSMTMTRVAAAQSSGEFVIGTISRTPDLRSFSFIPGLNLAHTSGTAERYFFNLRSGDLAPRDLAGNRIQAQLPQVAFDLNPAAFTVRNGGRVTRFSHPDEDSPFGGDAGILPEWNGQHFYDLQSELIRPRAVSRFQGVADRENPVVAVMNPFPSGVQTPLSPFGCRLLQIYRYIDVGFSLTDQTNYNVDVEGLAWAPASEQITADVFPEYEMRLGHSWRAPDEVIDQQNLFPAHPNTGLTPAFALQVLTPNVSPMKIVHPRDQGYTIDPGNAFRTATGTLMLPWPMNTNPSNDPILYTWRDTTIQGRAGNNGNGVDPESVAAAGLDRYCMYNESEVQTIGLPLLIEHRCYPAAADALGNNSLDVAFAVNSSRKPYFRAFSVGGFAAGSVVVTVDPDLEERANGGFNPAMNGAPSPGQDPVVYYGAIDMVVRVSRSVSVWFEVTDPTGGTFLSPQFSQPVFEPRSQDQPSGTTVELAFRGALAIADAPPGDEANDPRFNALSLDAYGNFYEFLLEPPVTTCGGNDDRRDLINSNVPIEFLGGDDVWNEANPDADQDPLGIDGAQYYQIRVSFGSNTVTGLVPTLSAVAISWE